LVLELEVESALVSVRVWAQALVLVLETAKAEVMVQGLVQEKV